MDRTARSGQEAEEPLDGVQPDRYQRVMLATAGAIDADVIVVGARERRGMLARLGLGSVSRKLVRWADCSVLVIRGGEAEG